MNHSQITYPRKITLNFTHLILIGILGPLLIKGTNTLKAQSFLSYNDYRYQLIKKHADIHGLNNFNIRGQHSYSQNQLRHLVISEQSDSKQSKFPYLLTNPHNQNKKLSTHVSLRSGFFFSSLPDRDILDIDASKNHILDTSLFFDQDRALKNESNAFIDPYIHLNFNDKVEFNAGSYISFNEKSNDIEADVYNANIHLKFSKLRVILGKSSIQWNLARINSLNLSNTTPPLWALRIMNDEEMQFSNFFKFLGPFKYETFISILDGNRRNKNPYLVGYKFSFSPIKRLELGLSYTVLFGGGSRDSNPLIYLGDSFTNASGVSNRNFIFDVRYQLLPKYIEVYAEFLGEDCCGPFPFVTPRDVQNMFGIHFHQLFGTPKFDASFEIASSSYIAYRHGNFTSGFINQGKVLGHSIGPDGLGIYGKINYFNSERFIASFIGSYERSGTADFDNIFFGNTDPNIETLEKSYQAGLNWIWNTYYSENKKADIFSLNGNIAYVHTQNFNYQRDNNRDDLFLGISGKFMF